MNNSLPENQFYQNIPQMVIFEITTKCNLSCTYCTARKLIKNPADLPLDKIELLADNLKAFQYVGLCGLGEPFVHRNFYEVLGILMAVRIVIVSNGSVPIDFKRLTVHGNVDILTFSVDGATEEAMQKVCSKYKFDNLIKNLETAMEYKVNIAFNTTISPDTLDELELIAELGLKYKINILKIGLPLGQAKWVRQNTHRIHSTLALIEKKMAEFGIDYEGPFVQKCTYNNAPIAVLSMNGNVFPCCDYYCRRPLLGNLFQSNLQSFWEKRAFKDFKSGRFCFTCQLYHNKPDLSSEPVYGTIDD